MWFGAPITTGGPVTRSGGGINLITAALRECKTKTEDDYSNCSNA